MDRRTFLKASAGANLFKHLAAFADKNGFLAFALAEDGGSDADELSFLFIALDDHRGGVRDFFRSVEQNLFTDQFGDQEAKRLVG